MNKTKTIKKMKRQAIESRKYLKPHINKGFVSKVYNELSKLNSKKKKQSKFKNGKKPRTDISPKRRYRWQISTLKDVQH